MVIALFSDIHANLPAFDRMLRHMDGQKPDAAYCLGDLVGYNVWPNEVIAEISRRGIATLAGNHDQKVAKLQAPTDSLAVSGKNYAYHLIDGQGRRYLQTLPAHIRLEYKINNNSLNLVLAHGSTRSINEYILEDTGQDYLLDMMQEADADMLFVGHSHKPFHRILTAPDGRHKHIVNIGSVGKPKDGDPRGCYVLLGVNENSSLADKESIAVEFIRFEYDIEKAARAIEDSPLPYEFAEALRSGF